LEKSAQNKQKQQVMAIVAIRYGRADVGIGRAQSGDLREKCDAFFP